MSTTQDDYFGSIDEPEAFDMPEACGEDCGHFAPQCTWPLCIGQRSSVNSPEAS